MGHASARPDRSGASAIRHRPPHRARPAGWPLRCLRLLVLAALLGSLLLTARPARAATFTVNTLADPAPALLSCTPTCPLRTALALAAPGDTIQFGVTGTISLTAALGPLVANASVTIQGPGQNQLAIDGGGATRILTVPVGRSVTLDGLTIRNGSASGVSGDGGGIHNSGSLTVRNSTVRDSIAGNRGGGIFNDGGGLTITNSTVAANRALSATSFLAGGGIHNIGGTVIVTGSTISANTSESGDGGGIVGNGGTLTVSGSSVLANRVLAGSGGGIAATGGSVTVIASGFAGNTATQGAGLAFISATATVADSSITTNVADHTGGGLLALGTLQLTVTNSTIDGNSADARGGGVAVEGTGTAALVNSSVSRNSNARDGGGIAVSGGTVELTNSTVSSNNAARGGGIWAAGGSTTRLAHATVSDNAATTSAGGIGTDAATVSLLSTIVANSVGRPTCEGNAAVVSRGNNLADTAACFPASPAAGDLVAPALLGPLLVNAPGTTATHALLPGSPAIDGVTQGDGLLACANSVPIDQRGVRRPQAVTANRCDIGAFELDGNTRPTVGAIADQVTDEDTPTPAIPFTVGDGQTPAAALSVAADSDNPALLPPGAITLGGGDAARTIRLAPAPDRSGVATVTVTVGDGVFTAQRTFALTVNAVNDPPVAADDAYAVAAGQALTVAAGRGVLANDADAEGTPLTAVLVQGPAAGSLALQPDGGFTFAPGAGFAGPATFTYRASDGQAGSDVATATINVVASACAPRPRVSAGLAPGGGKLNVRVEATPLNTRQNNPLRRVVFDRLDNATVTLNGQGVAAGQAYAPPPNTFAVQFVVARVAAGRASTVHFTVEDGCGSWKTFVGGGTAAGF